MLFFDIHWYIYYNKVPTYALFAKKIFEELSVCNLEYLHTPFLRNFIIGNNSYVI